MHECLKVIQSNSFARVNSRVHSFTRPDSMYYCNFMSTRVKIFFSFTSIILSSSLIKTISPSKMNISNSLDADSNGDMYTKSVINKGEKVPYTSK